MITVILSMVFSCILTAQESPEDLISENNMLHFSQPFQESFSMPFRLLNNLIVIPARINGSDTLFFILDTGLKMSIICELSMGESVDLKNAREIQLSGSASGKPTDAILTTGNTLEIGDLIGTNQEFIILTDNVLQLSTRLWTRIHGMLSIQAFRSFAIEINYDNTVISFNNPNSYHQPGMSGNFSSLPFQLIHGMPYIQANISDNNGSSFLVTYKPH